MLETLKIAFLLTVGMVVATWTLSIFAHAIFSAYFAQKEKYMRRLNNIDQNHGS